MARQRAREAVKLHKKGVKASRICEILGISKTTLYRMVNADMGIPRCDEEKKEVGRCKDCGYLVELPCVKCRVDRSVRINRILQTVGGNYVGS